MTRRIAMRWIGLVTLLASATWTRSAQADCQPETAIPSHFAALKGSSVNMREGPDDHDFKVSWTLVRRNLPVEIIRELDNWRCVRLPDGSRGWISETQIESRRFVMVLGGETDYRPARSDPEDSAPAVASVQGGAIGRLDRCPGDTPGWCRVEFTKSSVTGWIRRGDLWGVYPTEIFPLPKP